MVETFLTNEKQFIDTYLYNKPFYETEYIKFGKKLGEELQYKRPGFDTRFIFEKHGLLNDGIYEQKYLVKHDNIYLVGFIDKIEYGGKVIHEYKTTVNLWDDEKCKRHLQPELYSTLISLNNDKFEDREIKLCIFETVKGNSGLIYLTGKCKIVERLCTTEQQYKMLEWIEQKATLISDYYKKWVLANI